MNDINLGELGYSYSAANAKKIAEIESVVNSSVMYKILELLKNINTQLGVLEYQVSKEIN